LHGSSDPFSNKQRDGVPRNGFTRLSQQTRIISALYDSLTVTAEDSAVCRHGAWKIRDAVTTEEEEQNVAARYPEWSGHVVVSLR
jgi:hypothetical protein